MSVLLLPKSIVAAMAIEPSGRVNMALPISCAFANTDLVTNSHWLSFQTTTLVLTLPFQSLSQNLHNYKIHP